VSPARARTSLDEIVAAGRELLETGGPDALTMQAVAQRVGVKAPSLYKRLPSREALVAAIVSETLEDLVRDLTPLGRHPDPLVGLRAVATSYRAFALTHPRTYELLFQVLASDSRPTPELNERVTAPLMALTTRLVGAERALEAARLVTAFAHGFISMELAGAFRLGGDVDEAFGFGVDALIHGLAGWSPRRSSGSRCSSRR
jgi:AcrR family transcriptional regulator